MLNERQKMLVDDLRANGDKQGRYGLHNKNAKGEETFCCLGRACLIFVLENPGVLVIYEGPTEVQYNNCQAYLPKPVQDWFGFEEKSGWFNDTSLSVLNDGGKSFAEIADIIESEPEGLFVKA